MDLDESNEVIHNRDSSVLIPVVKCKSPRNSVALALMVKLKFSARLWSHKNSVFVKLLMPIFQALLSPNCKFAAVL